MNKKKYLLCLLVLIFTLLTAVNGMAHSGRTDKNGGHWDRKKGTYHYHNGGSSGSSSSTKKKTSSSSSASSGSTTKKSSAPKPTGTRVSDVSIWAPYGALYLYVGETVQINLDVIPADATNKKVAWSSSKKSVAAVDAEGIVTGIGAGTATIKATAQDGSKKSASITIYVIDAVQDIEFPVTSDSPKTHVASLQTILIRLGELSGSADGAFGKKTKAALLSASMRVGMLAEDECSYELYQELLDEPA